MHLGIEIEQAFEAGFTGVNTRAGDLMFAKYENTRKTVIAGADATRVVDRLHLVFTL